MSWFSKNNKKEAIPRLPDLPKLPDFHSIEETQEDYTLPQLPTLPSNLMGEKFSRNIIKQAVSGEKEEKGAAVNDFEEKPFQKIPMFPKPILKEINEPEKTKTFRREIPEDFKEAVKRTKFKEEPIFIRIDKFEESLKIFEQTKERILEIEKMLRETRKIREEEEKELEIWGQEIQNLKNQIEKVNEDIFSKVE